MNLQVNDSLSKWNKTEEFRLQVARGQIRGHQIRHIFGYNPDVDQVAEETVWTAGGLYTHASTPTIMTVSSTSASDTSAGTGARQIYLLGINGTGGEVSETVTLNGQTAVNTVHQYTEIQSSLVTSVGSGGSNAGNISIGTGTVTGGVPAVIYGHMLAGENGSLMGHYTVPIGYTGYLMAGSISAGSTQAGKTITGRLKYRDPTGIIHTSAIVSFSEGKVPFDFDYPIRLEAESCISATVKSTSDNEQVSCYFQLLLIKNQEI
jgi:hypothetical protein